MKNIILCLAFTAFLFCRNEKAEIKKEEQNRLLEKIETERLITFSDKFRTALENRNLHHILDLLEDTVDIDECYFEKPNNTKFFAGSYSFEKKKHSAEFLEGKGVLYSCLFDLSSLIQKKLAPPSILSFSEFYRDSSTKLYHGVRLKKEEHSENTYFITAEAPGTQRNLFTQKIDFLIYRIWIYENSQGNLQIRRFEIVIPAYPYYRIHYDTAGASVPVIDAIRNNDPKKLLKYLSDSVYYHPGGDGPMAFWFDKHNKKQVSEFIRKRGKLYNIIFDTERSRTEDGELGKKQKSFRDSLLDGVITKPLGPVCGIDSNDDRLLIFGNETQFHLVINFSCPRKDCNKCKIQGFMISD